MARGGSTSRSIILVTPDGERSMTTYLGASAALGPENLDLSVARQARLGFVEGYIFDTEPGRRAVWDVLEAGPVAITLSDPGCVRRNRDAFLRAFERASVVFGNAKEMAALSEASAEDGMRLCADIGPLTVCTRSAHPTLIRNGPARFEVPVERVEGVIDTTGAGDQFAAGFLHAMLTGAGEVDAAIAGGRAAGRIIRQAGARPPIGGDGPHMG